MSASPEFPSVEMLFPVIGADGARFIKLTCKKGSHKEHDNPPYATSTLPSNKYFSDIVDKFRHSDSEEDIHLGMARTHTLVKDNDFIDKSFTLAAVLADHLKRKGVPIKWQGKTLIATGICNHKLETVEPVDQSGFIKKCAAILEKVLNSEKDESFVFFFSEQNSLGIYDKQLSNFGDKLLCEKIEPTFFDNFNTPYEPAQPLPEPIIKRKINFKAFLLATFVGLSGLGALVWLSNKTYPLPPTVTSPPIAKEVKQFLDIGEKSEKEPNNVKLCKDLVQHHDKFKDMLQVNIDLTEVARLRVDACGTIIFADQKRIQLANEAQQAQRTAQQEKEATERANRDLAAKKEDNQKALKESNERLNELKVAWETTPKQGDYQEVHYKIYAPFYRLSENDKMRPEYKGFIAQVSQFLESQNQKIEKENQLQIINNLFNLNKSKDKAELYIKFFDQMPADYDKRKDFTSNYNLAKLTMQKMPFLTEAQSKLASYKNDKTCTNSTAFMSGYERLSKEFGNYEIISRLDSDLVVNYKIISEEFKEKCQPPIPPTPAPPPPNARVVKVIEAYNRFTNSAKTCAKAGALINAYNALRNNDNEPDYVEVGKNSASAFYNEECVTPPKPKRKIKPKNNGCFEAAGRRFCEG